MNEQCFTLSRIGEFICEPRAGLQNMAMGQVVVSLLGFHTISDATPTLAQLMDMNYNSIHILKGF